MWVGPSNLYMFPSTLKVCRTIHCLLACISILFYCINISRCLLQVRRVKLLMLWQMQLRKVSGVCAHCVSIVSIFFPFGIKLPVYFFWSMLIEMLPLCFNFFISTSKSLGFEDSWGSKRRKQGVCYCYCQRWHWRVQQGSMVHRIFIQIFKWEWTQSPHYI